MKTKAYARFLNRSAHFDADIELVDVLGRAIKLGKLTPARTEYIFEGVSPTNHPRLSHRISSDHNRLLAVTHLKSTLCSSFLKDIYEDVTLYLRELLQAAASNGLDPNRLVGEQKVTFEANDLLKCKKWTNVVSLVSDAIFRRLENEKNTAELLQKMSAKLNLGVDIAKINAALPYFEIRHLLVHADGIADGKFCSAYPSIGGVTGRKIPLNYRLLAAARVAINDLVLEFDSKVISEGVVATNETQP